MRDEGNEEIWSSILRNRKKVRSNGKSGTRENVGKKEKRLSKSTKSK